MSNYNNETIKEKFEETFTVLYGNNCYNFLQKNNYHSTAFR